MSFKENHVHWSLASVFRSASLKHSSRSLYAGQWRSRSLRAPITRQPERLQTPTVPNSTPDESDSDDCVFDDDDSRLCRVRSFKTTGRRFENQGDTFRRRSRHSLQSTGSTASDGRQRLSSTCSDVSNVSELSQVSTCTTVSSLSCLVPAYYRIAILGASGVGKTSLLRQCLTSEFTNSFETASQEEEEDDNTMCVLLDGEESMVELVEDMSLGECEARRVDAYIVAFSVTCGKSFKVATSIIQQLRVERSCDNAVILVANKVDLVRQRKVKTEDMRRLADKYSCKCVETSTAINHNVDDLVVGILTQIRLRLRLQSVVPDNNTVQDSKGQYQKLSTTKKLKVLSFISRLFKHAKHRARSCENLLH